MAEQKLDGDTANDIDLLHDLIGRALRQGADAADAVMFEGISLSHARRLGKTEKLERSESRDLGLRVLIGKRQAMVSSSDRSPKMLDELVERTIAMARAVPEDPFIGLADPAEVAQDWPALDMLDPDEPDADTLIERARAAEDAALAVEGVTNSEGAEAGWGRSRIALVASNGFAGGYAGSSHGVSASVIGGSGAQMERDYDFASAVYAADLRDPAEIGRNAGERTVKRLGARKMPTGRVPVVFDPRVARSLISHLLGRDFRPVDRARHQFSEGQARPADLPRGDHDHRGPAPHARPPLEAVRCRGPANRRRALIDSGVLTTWLLDLRSARQLGLTSTGHAARGTASPPSPVSDEHLDRARRGEPGRADGRHQAAASMSPS